MEEFTNQKLEIYKEVLNCSEKLDLTTKEYTEEELRWIFEAIKINNKITKLDLSSKEIEEELVKELFESIKHLDLKKLNLRNNKLNNKEAIKQVSLFLCENKTLNKLILSLNSINEHSILELSETLKSNQTLSKLYLSQNRLLFIIYFLFLFFFIIIIIFFY